MKKTFLLLLFSLSIFSASAKIWGVKAALNGANVVPANASTNIGAMVGTFDDATNILWWTVSFTIPSSNSYFFYEGAAGVNGSSFMGSTSVPSPSSGGSPPLPPARVALLMAGNIYLVVNSGSFPSGEIRGQLIVGEIEYFNEVTKNKFYGIGGYAHTDGYIPNGSQPSPYVWSGPSPQNDFTYIATTADGSALYGSFGELSTLFTNRPITLTFKGNNVRKLGLNVYEENTNGDFTSGSIVATITTNLNNTATLTSTNGARFVGFRVLNVNEYIVSATFSANSGVFTSLDNIMFGDDSPQNVALNFDGVDDYVSTNANVGNFNTNDNFTVTCWIKPDPNQIVQSGGTPSENDIISKWAGLGAGVNNNYPFVIRYLNSTNANVAERGKIRVGQWDGTNFPIITSTTAVNDGRWHHVAFVKTGTLLKLYIDGIQEGGDVTDNASNATNNTTPLQFGRRGNNESYFKGEIDEIRIWAIAKTATQIANERFCKTPDPSSLYYFYNFNNGVPHDNNTIISQVQDVVGTNHGTLNNFAKTGDASNFVTGQVKYVKRPNIGTVNGSSWATAFVDVQAALTPNTCNDLFDIYVASFNNPPYNPSNTGDVNASFNIPTGMRIYGGFAGTEKNINERNMALIHTTNKTTLTGDLGINDTPFDFTTNRTDNSLNPVTITGNNVVFDGFTVSGSNGTGAGIAISGTNATIKTSRVIDNANYGLYILGDNATIANCSILGNGGNGMFIPNLTATIKECLIANNGLTGISIFVGNGTRQTTITNSTIASNANYGISVQSVGGTSTNTLKNSLIYGNASGGILNTNSVGTLNNTITYSLVQGNAGGSNGNLNGNTVNPQFVSPLANTVRSDAGDYRLKWCSLAIGAGDNVGISPLDLDRNLRLYRTNVDMGAYEHMGNTPTGASPIDITYTIDIPNYEGVGVQRITSAAKILAPAGTVNFTAPNSITLNPGFEARGVGKYFKAQIGANVSCSN